MEFHWRFKTELNSTVYVTSTKNICWRINLLGEGTCTVQSVCIRAWLQLYCPCHKDSSRSWYTTRAYKLFAPFYFLFAFSRIFITAFFHRWTGSFKRSNADICKYHTAKNQYRKFEKNIPRKGIARPQSQFPHSCACERFIYSHDWSAYSAAVNMLTDPGNI